MQQRKKYEIAKQIKKNRGIFVIKKLNEGRAIFLMDQGKLSPSIGKCSKDMRCQLMSFPLAALSFFAWTVVSFTFTYLLFAVNVAR